MPRKKKQWYAGHAVFLFRVKSGRQKVFTVWENVYLIKAGDFDEARRRTEVRGREDEEKEGWRVDGKPAELVFEGVRKVVECTPDFMRYPFDQVFVPHDGMEVTFNAYRLSSKEQLSTLLRGNEVDVVWEE